MGFLAKGSFRSADILLDGVKNSLSTLSMYKVCLMGSRWLSEIKVSNRSLQHSAGLMLCQSPASPFALDPWLLLCLFIVDAIGHRSPNRGTAVPNRLYLTCVAPALTKVLFTQAAFCLKNKKDEKMFTSKSQGNWALNPHRQFNKSNMLVSFHCSETELSLSDNLL